MEKTTLVDYAKYKLERAHEALNSVPILINAGHLNDSMNRIYYSGFYIVSALVILDGFSTSKHKQLIGYFNREYIKTGKIKSNIGKILNEAFERRIASDYHDFVYLTKTEIENYYTEMKGFVSTIDELIQKKINAKIP